jgi:glycosyltransferase involved in cell wall biosynthesis
VKLLVWHWGRRGAGPIFAVQLRDALVALGFETALSLAEGAEILAPPSNVQCDWAEPTYANAADYLLQRTASLLPSRRCFANLKKIKPDIAICAMPALLDKRMLQALRQSDIPYAVLVHDATAHPGDRLTFRLLGQNRLLRDAAMLFALSSHVEGQLRAQGFGKNGQAISKLWHPPFDFGGMKPAFAHGGQPRLLSFGRLLPYKGLDLLADALTALGPDLPFEVRICGDGPVSDELARLQALPGVEVDHRWIPESELPGLIEWSDAVVLPYREASQSGVAAAAIGQGRMVVATNVGGLPEQLANTPGAILCEPNAAAIAEALLQIKPPATPASTENAQSNWREMAGEMVEALIQESSSFLKKRTKKLL